MLVSILEYDSFLGRILTGRIYSGTAKVGMPIKSLSLDGKQIEQGRLTKLLAFDGIKRVPVEEAQAGDIVAVAGLGTYFGRRYDWRSAISRSRPVDADRSANHGHHHQRE